MSRQFLLRVPILWIMALLLFVAPTQAQVLSGSVDYPALGVRFTIPEGWIAQETEVGLVLGSNTEPGLMLVSQHAYRSLQEIQQAGDEGINDSSLSLQRGGDYRIIDEHSVGAPFAGVNEGQPARAYAIGVLNPHGAGVSVLALTTESAYSKAFEERAWLLANSFEFEKPDNTAEIKDWREFLSDVRLTHMTSSSSSGPSVEGYSTYSGHSSTSILHLCRAGHYRYGSSASYSVDTGSGFAHGGGDEQGNGVWEVIGNAHGQPYLRLTSNDGDVFELQLQYEDDKTFLDGTRYFRTLPDNENGHAPNCP
jgi:hypothetical protein